MAVASRIGSLPWERTMAGIARPVAAAPTRAWRRVRMRRSVMASPRGNPVARHSGRFGPCHIASVMVTLLRGDWVPGQSLEQGSRAGGVHPLVIPGFVPGIKGRTHRWNPGMRAATDPRHKAGDDDE